VKRFVTSNDFPTEPGSSNDPPDPGGGQRDEDGRDGTGHREVEDAGASPCVVVARALVKNVFRQVWGGGCLRNKCLLLHFHKTICKGLFFLFYLNKSW